MLNECQAPVTVLLNSCHYQICEKLAEMLPITTMSFSGSMAGATGRMVTLLPCSVSFSRLLMLFVVVFCGLEVANGLKCYKCGQYNEGVGSITPCLNYSEQHQHLYLKECSKKSDNYCVVSELKSSYTRDIITAHCITFQLSSFAKGA